MKNQKYWNIALLVLPLFAWIMEIMPGSVQVLPTDGSQVEGTFNFFSLTNPGLVGLCTPFAAIMTCITFMFVVIYVVSKKKRWLSCTKVCSFLVLFAAPLPIVVRPEPMVIPNVVVPIAMGLECLICIYLAKKDEVKKDERNEGRRLGK